MLTSNMDSPSNVATELLHRGLSESQAGRAENALQLFRQAVTVVPESGAPHLLIGAELMQIGRVDDAEAAYATALHLDPGLDIARFQLGLLRFTSGRVSEAMATWEPLSAQPRDDALAHAVRGFAALAVDDFERATGSFLRSKSLATENVPLARDMQMMIDRIKSLAAALRAATAAPDPSAGSTEAPDGADSHVLLSSYQHQGRPH